MQVTHLRILNRNHVQFQEESPFQFKSLVTANQLGIDGKQQQRGCDPVRDCLFSVDKNLGSTLSTRGEEGSRKGNGKAYRSPGKVWKAAHLKGDN